MGYFIKSRLTSSSHPGCIRRRSVRHPSKVFKGYQELVSGMAGRRYQSLFVNVLCVYRSSAQGMARGRRFVLFKMCNVWTYPGTLQQNSHRRNCIGSPTLDHAPAFGGRDGRKLSCVPPRVPTGIRLRIGMRWRGCGIDGRAAHGRPEGKRSRPRSRVRCQPKPSSRRVSQISGKST